MSAHRGCDRNSVPCPRLLPVRRCGIERRLKERSHEQVHAESCHSRDRSRLRCGRNAGVGRNHAQVRARPNGRTERRDDGKAKPATPASTTFAVNRAARCHARRWRSACARRCPGAEASVALVPQATSPQTILIDRSGRPSSLYRITSPRTTGPTFSGVPE